VRHLENKKPCFYRAFYFLPEKVGSFLFNQ